MLTYSRCYDKSDCRQLLSVFGFHGLQQQCSGMDFQSTPLCVPEVFWLLYKYVAAAFMPLQTRTEHHVMMDDPPPSCPPSFAQQVGVGLLGLLGLVPLPAGPLHAWLSVGHALGPLRVPEQEWASQPPYARACCLSCMLSLLSLCPCVALLAARSVGSSSVGRMVFIHGAV